MASGNGGIIGVSNVVQNGCTATATASGIWAMNTVYDYVKSSDWVYNFDSLDYLVIAGGGSSGNVSSAGGGAGGIAGPMGAAVGAGAGAAAGQLLAGDEDLKAAKAQTQQVIASLSKGDVEGMLAAAAGKQKGFVDEAIDGVIGFVKLCLIFLVLWNLIPIIYTRYIHKKHSNGNPKKT